MSTLDMAYMLRRRREAVTHAERELELLRLEVSTLETAVSTFAVWHPWSSSVLEELVTYNPESEGTNVLLARWRATETEPWCYGVVRRIARWWVLENTARPFDPDENNTEWAMIE